MLDMAQLRFGGRTVSLPTSRIARAALGIGLIVLGIFGFLPVLGFWMIPLGLLVLSIDFPVVRRARRKLAVRLIRWIKSNWPNIWDRFGAPHV